MRLTLSKTRLARAAVLVAWAASAGCQRLPYIDQSKEVPHENLGTIAQEDKEVQQAQFLSSYAADADAQGRQAPDHQRPRGPGDLAAAPSRTPSGSAWTTPRSSA